MEDRGEAQVNWLVCGQFGIGDRGKVVSLTRGDFNDVLTKADINVEATVPDVVGGSGSQKVTLKIDSLKKLSLKHVIGTVPELLDLAAKADKVAKMKNPTIEDLEPVFGPGQLLDAMRAILAPDAGSSPDKGDKADESSDVFETGDIQAKSAKSAIDMFVRSSSRSTKKAKPSSRKLRDLLEETLWAIAAEVLRSPEVSAVEQAWRGLRFMLKEVPLDSGMRVLLLETTPEHALEDLAARERGDDIDEPDCIFIPHDFTSTAQFPALAEFAEEELIPIVVGVHHSVFGTDDPQTLPNDFEALEKARNEDLPEWATQWDEIRGGESTRWLCAVANPVAVTVEGKGSAERKVFTSAVWGVGAMLAASYRESGGFARIFGKNGSIQAPAIHTIRGGSYNDTAAPTQAFYAIKPGEMLAKNGILGMGSARNSDQLALIKAPMVRGAADAVPLPAQILTGRVVRFATWVKPQLPEGCSSKTANEIFETAAGVFLFPGQERLASVRAATTNIDGKAHVVVRAAANAAIASIPFEIAFPLHLNWSVPAPEDGEAADPAPVRTQAEKDRMAKVLEEAKAIQAGGDAGGIASASVGFGVEVDKKDK